MSILTDIVARTRRDVAARRQRVPLDALERRCVGLPAAQDFAAALRRPDGRPRRAGPLRVIAEVKRASPSRGVIRADVDAAALARAYEAAGAHAVSVLTDAPFFQGSLEDLAAVHAAIGLPVLRKDFHLEPYQLWEARAAGADAVLLIVGVLTDQALRALLALCAQLSLAALVEVHGADELARALDAGPAVVGINNRDLATFEVSLETTFALLDRVPAHCVLVSESGIGCRADAARLRDAGVDAVLVGEGLLRHADVGAALRGLADPA